MYGLAIPDTYQHDLLTMKDVSKSGKNQNEESLQNEGKDQEKRYKISEPWVETDC